MLESFSESEIKRLEDDKINLRREMDTNAAQLGNENRTLRSDLETKSDAMMRMSEAWHSMRGTIEAIDGDLSVEDHTILRQTLDDGLEVLRAFYEDASVFVRYITDDVEAMRSDVSNAKYQIERYQPILLATHKSMCAAKKQQAKASDDAKTRIEALQNENRALTIKALQLDASQKILAGELNEERHARVSYQKKMMELQARVSQPPPQTLQAPPEALGSPKKQNAAMRSMEPSPWTSPRPSPRPSPRRRIAPADDDEASSEEAYHDANPAFYTPAEDLEESELSLIGKLDAERTYLQVEREAYKLLKDEKNKSQPMKTAEEIVDDVLATNKEKLNTLLKMQREQRNGTGRGFLINSSRKQLDFSTKE